MNVGLSLNNMSYWIDQNTLLYIGNIKSENDLVQDIYIYIYSLYIYIYIYQVHVFKA